MTLDNLHKRIDKLLDAIHQQLPPEQETPASAFRRYLFTEIEGERLQTFIDQVLEPNLHYKADGRMDLSGLTSDEHETFWLWLHLQAALDQEDIEAAAKYRRYLSWSTNELVEMFLAIGEDNVPDFKNAPIYTDKHITYHLYRGSYRSLKQMIERALNQRREIDCSHLDDMRIWCEAFATPAAI